MKTLPIVLNWLTPIGIWLLSGLFFFLLWGFLLDKSKYETWKEWFSEQDTSLIIISALIGPFSLFGGIFIFGV